MGESLYILIAKSLILNGIVLLSGWLAATRLAGRRRGVDRLPAAFAVSASLIVISFEILGVFGEIDFNHTLAAHSAALLVIWFIYRRGRFSEKNSAEAAAPAMAVTGAPAGKKSIPRSLILWIFIFYFIVAASFALLMPPAPTDAFLDHLVFPAEWLRAGRITLVQTLSPEQATTYYPSNGELIYLWLMLPLRNDLLTGLMEAVSLLVCAAAAFRIGKRAGLGDGNAIACAAAGALTPVALRQVQQFGVDLFFTAAFLTAAAHLLPDAEGRRTKGELLIAGLAAGLALGSKFLGAIFFALLFPLVFAAPKEKTKFTSATLFIAAAAATGAFWYVRNLAATGSPFYPLGLSVFGAQIFPGAYARAAMLASYMHTPVSDFTAFKNIFVNFVFGPWLPGGIAFVLVAACGGSLMRSGHPYRAQKIAGLLAIVAAAVLIALMFTGESGSALLMTAACFVLPAAVLFPSEKSWPIRYLFALAPAAVFIFWNVNPYNIANNARFVIPGMFLLFIFAAYAIEASGWDALWLALVPGLLIGNYPAARFFVFIKDALDGSGHAADAFPLVVAAVVAVVFGGYFLGLLVGPHPRQALKLVPLLAVAALVAVSLKSDYIEKHRYDWYGGHYLSEGWSAMNELEPEKPATIAYTGNCSPYGLYGNRLKNRVLYVNIDGAEGHIFHDYEIQSRTEPGYAPPADSAGLNHIFRKNGNYDAWRKRLAAEKADYLFSVREFHPKHELTIPVEMKWALTHPETFRLVFRNRGNFIFKILKGF